MTDTQHTTKIAFLGTGSMNGAILRGVLASGFSPETVRATTNSVESARRLAEETGVEVRAAGEDAAANRDIAEWADVVVLGVKPKDIVSLCQEIAPAVSDAVVVSVAAGVTLAMMEAALPGAAIVRCMPNTPSSLRLGVLSVSPNAHVRAAQLDCVRTVLGAAGEVVEISEEQINALIAVSGSGPAYAFYLAEAMAAGGEALGLDAELSRRIAALTIRGAGAMLGENDDAEALRRAVTSPQGTTDRAITAFEELGLREIIARGQEACAARASEMERELGSRVP